MTTQLLENRCNLLKTTYLKKYYPSMVTRIQQRMSLHYSLLYTGKNMFIKIIDTEYTCSIPLNIKGIHPLYIILHVCIVFTKQFVCGLYDNGIFWFLDNNKFPKGVLYRVNNHYLS